MLHASTILAIGVIVLSLFHAIATLLIYVNGRRRFRGLEARVASLEQQADEQPVEFESWRRKTL